SKCTPNMSFRKIPRDVHEDARDATRALMGTPQFAKSRNERKKVEMRFAHLKTHHRFERMRLRGLSGARDEFHLVAIVQSLKILANYIWRPLLNVPVACGIPPCRHRAELEDTRQLYLATFAERPCRMRRMSVSGVQPRQLDAGFYLR